jgi:hypothetical protein
MAKPGKCRVPLEAFLEYDLEELDDRTTRDGIEVTLRATSRRVVVIRPDGHEFGTITLADVEVDAGGRFVEASRDLADSHPAPSPDDPEARTR